MDEVFVRLLICISSSCSVLNIQTYISGKKDFVRLSHEMLVYAGVHFLQFLNLQMF